MQFLTEMLGHIAIIMINILDFQEIVDLQATYLGNGVNFTGIEWDMAKNISNFHIL